jgi:hypothetical protein
MQLVGGELTMPTPHLRLALALVISTFACRQERAPSRQASAGVRARAVTATPVDPDHALHEMMTEIAATKACSLVRSRWTGIRSLAGPSVAGTLRIRSCDAFRDGVDWQFVVGTSGWVPRDVVHAAASQGGYERFEATVTLHGPLAITYDEAAHIASVQFRTDRPISVHMLPTAPTVTLPNLDDSIVNAIVGVVVGRSVPESGESQPLAIRATLPLCTGTWSVSVGARSAASDDQAPVPVELAGSGIALFGPFPNSQSVTLALDARQGAPRVDLVCEDDAARIADAFAHGNRAPDVTALASKPLHGQSSMHVIGASCPVVMVAAATEQAGAQFTWARSAAESRMLVEPPVHCESSSPPVLRPER